MNMSDMFNYCHVKLDKWWSWECMKTNQVPTHYTPHARKNHLINICKLQTVGRWTKIREIALA
jgi:hypothetical protein